MATTTITTGKFIRDGYITKDLRASMVATPPSANAIATRAALQITQNCDFDKDIIDALAVDGAGTLTALIREKVRNNIGDSTLLPAMRRYYLNQKVDAINSTRYKLTRNSDVAMSPFGVYFEEKNLVDWLATLDPAWTLNNGVFTFTRPALIQVFMKFLIYIDIGGETEQALQWRLPDSGTNRIISVTPTLHLTGNFTFGTTQSISLAPVLFYPEHYGRQTRQTVTGSFKMAVKDATATLGRVDSMSVSLQRSTWVAKSVSGIYDAVTIIKDTPTTVADTSNYLELAQL